MLIYITVLKNVFWNSIQNKPLRLHVSTVHQNVTHSSDFSTSEHIHNQELNI